MKDNNFLIITASIISKPKDVDEFRKTYLKFKYPNKRTFIFDGNGKQIK